MSQARADMRQALDQTIVELDRRGGLRRARVKVVVQDHQILKNPSGRFGEVEQAPGHDFRRLSHGVGRFHQGGCGRVSLV